MSSVSLSSSLSVVSADLTVMAVRIVPTMGPSAVRRPFHLVLLLDTSGSMEGARIVAVQRTLHLLIDAMTDGDTLSVITYSHDARIVARAVALSSATRPILHASTEAIVAGGGTNLESALMAITSLQSDVTPTIDAVFILTDGQINSGVTSVSGIKRILTSLLPVGTPVNTLGFGADHNCALLRDVALGSRGTYTYADAEEMIPAIIGDITGGLSTEVARNAVLTIPPGWFCTEIGATADTYTIGSLIADKTQWVVLIADVATVPAEIRLNWNGGATRCSVDSTISADEIIEQYERTCVASLFIDITTLLEHSNIPAALRRLEEKSQQLAASKAAKRPFVIRMMARVDEMREALSKVNGHGVQYAPLVPRYNGAGALLPPAIDVALPLAPLLSRMASNTSALGAQRGFFTQLGADVAEATETSFSSPTQRATSRTISSQYTESKADEE